MPYPENFDLSSKPGGYFENPRIEMISYIPGKPEKILEVGCGSGIFAAVIREKFSCSVWGIEIDPSAASAAERVIDNVLRMDIADAIRELEDESFDVIFFNDVLEHLPDPFVILHQIRAKLKPGGVIICSIPNVLFIRNLWRLLFRKEWTYEEDGILDKTHLRFFTKKSIIDMFELTGYKIETIEGINPVKDFRFTLLNTLTLGFLAESKYLQFASVASVVG